MVVSRAILAKVDWRCTWIWLADHVRTGAVGQRSAAECEYRIDGL